MKKQQKNVIIGGSTKCGTTSLFEYLKAHSQICASVIKETRFFWGGEYELAKQKINGREAAKYSEFFSECSEHEWMLEATPDYLYSAVAAQKIKNSLPDCRIIFILRNPEDRIISWFKYGKQRGLIEAQFQPEDYLKLLEKADISESPQYLRALEQGKYATYLRHYFDLFGKENIFVALHSDLQKDPVSVMISICDFLEMDKSFYYTFDFKIYNPSLNIKNAKRFSKYVSIKKKLRSFNNGCPAGFRNFFKRVLKPFDVLYLKLKSTEWKEIGLSSSRIIFLKEYYRADHALLEKMLNKKITW
jgi:hypothetical protein